VDANGSHLEFFEPVPPGATFSSGSSWWTWTAPRTGATSIRFDGKRIVGTIYEGTSFEEMRALASTFWSGNPIRIHAREGQTYAIQVVNHQAGEDGHFSISLEQDLRSPPNDHFENRKLLSGETLSEAVNSEWATLESGGPSPSRSQVWYEWAVPQSGLYTGLISGASWRIFEGTDLSNLRRIELGSQGFRARFREGQQVYISVGRGSNVLLEIDLIQGVPNDEFADRHHLGSGLGSLVEQTIQFSTLEDGDPLHELHPNIEGTVWWSWTAPKSGGFYLQREVRPGSSTLGVFRGESLEELQVLEEPFVAEEGQTYHICAGTSSSTREDKIAFTLSMENLPNDDFADRISISPDLPFVWEGYGTGMTIEDNEIQSQEGTAWWEWTAPRDGEITLKSQRGTLRIYTGGSSLTSLSFYQGEWSQVIQVFEGVRYFLEYTSQSFFLDEISMDWTPTEQVDPVHGNTSFEDAVPILALGQPFVISISDSGPRSLYYYWDSDRDGTLTLTGDSVTAVFFSGPDAQNLERVPIYHRRENGVEVKAGVRYWIRIFLSQAGPASWTAALGPEGDVFREAPALPASEMVVWQGATTGAGWEFGEPRSSGFTPPNRTVWRTWRAPTSAKFRFSILNLEGIYRGFKVGIFTGNELTYLFPIAIAKSGSFDAIEGVTYHIVVDSEDSQGPFQLNLDRISIPFEDWKVGFFGKDEGGSRFFDDPDRDGRGNLLEMALGSHPKVADGEAKVWLEVQNGFVAFSVLRPVGLEGLAWFFDYSSGAPEWRSVEDLEFISQVESTDAGMEIFRVIVPVSQFDQTDTMIMRLRVGLSPNR